MTTDLPAWFSAEEAAGLPDFWRVYEAHYEALNESALRAMRAEPRLAALLATIAPDQLKAEQRAGRERMRRLIKGDWSDYQNNLRVQGAVYARMGISFETWYRLVRIAARDILPLLVSAHANEPARLTAALLGMQAFFDWAMAMLGEVYLSTKEAAIRASEQDLATTLNSIGDGVIATDLDGCVARMNPVAERLTGWELTEAKGKPLEEVFHIVNARTRSRVESPAARVLREGIVVGLANHTALVAKDGTERPIADSGAPIRDEHGTMRGVVLVFRDQTEQYAAEAALRRSENRFRRLSEAGLLGVIETDASSGLVEANDAFLAMVGHRREDLIGGKLGGQELTPPEWASQDEAAREELASSGVAHLYEKEYLRKDGGRVPVLLGAAMLDARRSIAFVLDISRQKQLEGFRIRSLQLETENRRIQEANRLKSEFLANMSHELRTPLNAIIGFAELLHDGQVQPETPQFKEFLGDILASGRHLLQLINDVLDLAKVEAGRVEFHPEAVELRKLVGEVVAILRTIAASKRIRVAIDISPELPMVHVDASRLKQVLYNYLSNALKFTGEEGRVAVRARPEGASFFRVEVEDTGIGISDADAGKLFSEFQQLDAGAAKKHEGTGLGLALTKRLAEAQGGAVGVTSAPGKGSTFFVMLPRSATQAEPMPAPRRLPGAPGAPSILVIEDNPRDQAVIVRALTSAGYSVETASSGAQAIARSEERAFDAITLDLLLPDANGLEVLRSIRAGALNHAVPVIVITVVTERGAAAGVAVHDVLAKPLEESAMLKSLERAGVRSERSGHVLVVDDDHGSSKLMAATLARLGYRSVPVPRGAEGLRLSAEAPPMAVILDLLMPEMDGFEFLERFRQLPRCRSVPVIVWTVKDLTMEDHRRLRSTVQGVLQKGQDAGAAVLEALRSFLPAVQEQ